MHFNDRTKEWAFGFKCCDINNLRVSRQRWKISAIIGCKSREGPAPAQELPRPLAQVRHPEIMKQIDEISV
jgi:hypothetical protein